ncbi:MAG TPA: protein kinase [Gemmataceae bacterium]|nr:protein kinase [Gemmataceae bacterium]
MIAAQQTLSLRDEARAIIKEWNRGGEPDAREVLDQRPEFRADKSLVVELAYEEYALRCEAGAAPDPATFSDRFPTFRQAVHAAVVGIKVLEDDAASLDRAPDVHWPEPGQRLSDLRILRELGRGSFARVYLALEESVGGRPVAVKLSAEGAAEAHTLGRLVHPHIVPIFSAGFADEVGLTAVTMPFLGAATLTDVIDLAYPVPHGPAPRDAAVVREAVRRAAMPGDPPPIASGSACRPDDRNYTDAASHIAEQIADALAHLHKEGVVHRDLKPSNVLLRPDGQAVLLDFNLSADARSVNRRIGGSLPYMPPEQLRAFLGEAPSRALDGRLDLFALGVILYQVLTGELPYGTPTAGLPPAESVKRMLQRQPQGFRPVRGLNPAVDSGLARLIEKCLALDPADRPASAAQLAESLRRCQAWPARLRRWAGRRPFAAAAAAGLLLMAAGGAASEMAAPQLPADVREYNRGRAAYLDGDYAAAEELFKQAVQDCSADPKPRKYYMARAVGAMRLAEAEADEPKAQVLFSEAVSDLQQAERLQSDGPTAALLGYCISQTDPHAALLWYDRAVAAGYKSAALYNDRGFSRLHCNRVADAAQDIEAALQLEPNLQPARVNRWLVVLRLHTSAKAAPVSESTLADLQQAVELGLGSPVLCLSAARVFAAAAKAGHPSNPTICAAQTLFCLQKAIEAGATPATIQNDPLFNDVLKDVPEFRTLVQLRNWPAPSLTAPAHVIDPAPYVPE